MKLQEVFFFILIFNMVMWLLSAIGFGSITGAFRTPQSYIVEFAVGATIGLVVSIVAVATTAAFFREMNTDRYYVLGSIAALFFGFFRTGFVTFENLVAGFPMALNVVYMIEAVVGVLMLFALYQMVLGGWGNVE